MLDWFEQAACPQKFSVQFVSTTGQVSQPFYFFETIKHPCSTTWQVRRSDFDRMLLDNARARGVEVHQGAAVREVLMDGGRVAGVRADLAAGGSAAYHAGRGDRRVGPRHVPRLPARDEAARPGPEHDRIFTYYRGALRDPGLDAGATTVAYIPDKGWFWYIPLPDDIVSVGVVAEKDYLYRDTRDPAEIFAREAAACIWIENHLRPGVRVEPVRVTGEFSYRAEAVGGDGFCLAGDAFSFLDPVFSTGLFMALKSGEMAADAVHRGLAEGEVTAATFEQYGRDMRWALDQFRQLVLSFYNERFSFREFIRAYPDLHPRLVDALVGNVFADLGPLFDALREFSARDAPDRRTGTRLKMKTCRPATASSAGCSSTRPTARESCTSRGSTATWKRRSTRCGARPASASPPPAGTSAFRAWPPRSTSAGRCGSRTSSRCTSASSGSGRSPSPTPPTSRRTARQSPAAA